MKRIITILLLILSNSSIAQETGIYPFHTPPRNLPFGSYIKDLNGELDKYVGLWKGEWNGKTIFLELRKIKYSFNNNQYYEDMILGERKIINSNGVVEIDRISNFDNLRSEFFGMFPSLTTPGSERITFYPKNMCTFHADIDLVLYSPQHLLVQITNKFVFSDTDCVHNNYVQQYGNYPYNFPESIVLIKQ